MTQPYRGPTIPAPDLDSAVSALRERGLRVSSARRLALEALYAAEGPVSADRIAGGLEGRFPISDLASVYRNLETLEAAGLVRHFHLGHGPGLYAPADRHREYLLCESCDRLISVGPSELDSVRELIRARHGFEARFTHFPIVGLCPECQAPGREIGDGLRLPLSPRRGPRRVADRPVRGRPAARGARNRVRARAAARVRPRPPGGRHIPCGGGRRQCPWRVAPRRLVGRRPRPHAAGDRRAADRLQVRDARLARDGGGEGRGRGDRRCWPCAWPSSGFAATTARRPTATTAWTTGMRIARATCAGEAPSTPTGTCAHRGRRSRSAPFTASPGPAPWSCC